MGFEKCPIPIRLVRIKTGVIHIGFLDIDAIVSLQEYLKYRQSQQDIFKPSPIFVNRKNNPITDSWVRSSFRSMAKKSIIVKYDDTVKKLKVNSNTLRILLKSTLRACKVDHMVSDESIGHKTPDRFQKHCKEDIKKMREEYSKASPVLNIFSRLDNVINDLDSKVYGRSNSNFCV